MERVARPTSVGESGPSVSFEQLAHFEGPPDEFLDHLLAGQCSLADAERGAILRINPDGAVQPLAVHPRLPRSATTAVWLAMAAESARRLISSDAGTSVLPLREGESDNPNALQRHLLTLPIRSTSAVRGAAAFVIAIDPRAPASELPARRERLELSMQLLSLYEMRLTLDARETDLRHMKVALEVSAAVNAHDRFVSAAMALCNEVASRWHGQRVGLGFLKGRYVVLRAMSHTERFDRRMQLIQDLEAAMEESLDQDVEVLHPPDASAGYVSRATGNFSQRHGPVAVVSVPIRGPSLIGASAGEDSAEPRAVLTIDRPIDDPFDAAQIRTLRLACDLCATRLVDLYQRDRWFGARAAASARRGLATLIGPTHTWAKLLSLLGFAAILFLAFARGHYRAEGSFVIEPTRRQIVSAPFDGYLESVHVKIGDPVQADVTVLADFETAELRLQLASARAEATAERKRAALARRQGKEAEAQIADADAARIDAQIDLLEHTIGQAAIRSATSGVVVVGDLERRLGAPFKTGDLLFEVTSLEDLRAEIAVPEDQISDVRVAQTGQLATASFPGDFLPFVVEHINPVAEVLQDQNVFKVRVRLDESRPWLRPGMAGTGKIDVDRRSYLWIWTRRFVNWVRMKLWI
ncbi:MAG: HlyD family efflux transporter periplasmic adaptor subunit [Phycisphaerales bacterium]|nr:HlyD family efflux transporter periplasmic adaptor subunit [Phycisphaerales bacterium]